MSKKSKGTGINAVSWFYSQSFNSNAYINQAAQPKTTVAVASANPYEQLAREKKITALLEALDREAVKLTGARCTEELVSCWTLETWCQIGAKVGIKPPSEETIAQLRARMKARDRR